MISRKQAEDSLVKLGMLKFFPARADVTAEVGRLLNEICADDHEAKCLTSAILSQFDEWPGPLTVRTVQETLATERRKHQERAVQRANRDAHEAECTGYTVRLNEEGKYMVIQFCHQEFGYSYPQLLCRKGHGLMSVDPTLCDRLEEQELAARPGWVSYEEHWKRELAKNPLALPAISR